MQTVVSAQRLRKLLGSSLERTPRYLALADGLRLLIIDGRVPTGARLPSERDLTRALGLSRTTVTRAYELTKERGYLLTRRGAGSVTALPNDGQLSSTSELSCPRGTPEGIIDLSCASSSAPPDIIDAYQRALEKLPIFFESNGYFPSGLAVLREHLADWYTQRALPTSPDQIIITSGALNACAITARAITHAGERVLVENPSYPNALASLRRTGSRILGIPLDPEGWDTSMFVTAIRQTAPSAAYLIPDFQNPTGHLMLDHDRDELGQALNKARAPLIVDETMVELLIDDIQMPQPMAVYYDDCITLGSASKAFWGGLRIGWIRAPQARIGTLLDARLSFDLGSPLLEQLTLVELLKQRTSILEYRRRELQLSRDTLCDELSSSLPDWSFIRPSGGYTLWAKLPKSNSSVLAAVAERHQLWLSPGARFATDSGLEQFVRLTYARSASELKTAVHRLKGAWEEALDSPSPRFTSFIA